MHRLFCTSQNIISEHATIKDPELTHYLNDVLRIKPDEKILIFDEKSTEYLALVKDISSKSVELIIKSKRKISLQKNYALTVACAIPKKAKFDDIVDKLTQLGVDRIIPIVSERVIVKLDKEKAASRLERWRKIALSATQQSQRTALPVIEDVKHIEKLFSESNQYDLKLIAALIDERKPLKEILAQYPNAKNILFLIGPEGDFTPGEINLAKKCGFLPVTLGDLVLRVDTAAVAVASFIKLYRTV